MTDANIIPFAMGIFNGSSQDFFYEPVNQLSSYIHQT